VTKTDWEGIGGATRCGGAGAEALSTAHLAALEKQLPHVTDMLQAEVTGAIERLKRRTLCFPQFGYSEAWGARQRLHKSGSERHIGPATQLYARFETRRTLL
jgi:hypothetical protein